MAEPQPSRAFEAIRIAAGVGFLAFAGYMAWAYLRDAPAPSCPGDSIYCDRDAYIAEAAAICPDSLAERETSIINRVTTVEAYCTCMAGQLYDAAGPQGVWRLERGEATEADQQMLIQGREIWAEACLQP